MYRPEFQKAKNDSGKFYRNQGTGNMVEYCGHLLIAKPVFEFVDEPIAGGAFSYSVKQLSHLELTCEICGECFQVWADKIMNDEQFEYRLDECAKEVVKDIKKDNKGKKK